MGKQKKTKQFLVIGLACCLMVGILAGCSRERSQEQSAALVSLQKTVEYYEKNKQINNWEDLIALYGATQVDGLGVDWNQLTLPQTPVPDGSAGSLAQAIITNMAQGQPDQDLVKQLANLQNQTDGSFRSDSIEQHIWSMISLNVSQGADNYNYAGAVKYLLTFQGSDGGFHFENTTDSDVYLSGLAAISLSPFHRENSDNSSVKKLVKYFKHSQQSDGGYLDAKGESPSAISSAISGLSALGQDLPKSKGEKKTPLDALLTFQNEDGSFHGSGDGNNTPDPAATRRAAIALSDIVNGAETYVLLAQDAQEFRLEHTSGPAITISIDYPYETKMKDVKDAAVTVNQGSTALDALLYYSKLSGIPIAFDGSQQDGTISAINNVRKDDHGYDSHWVLKINGKTPEENAGKIVVNQGDHLEWSYIDSMNSLANPITPAAATSTSITPSAVSPSAVTPGAITPAAATN